MERILKIAIVLMIIYVSVFLIPERIDKYSLNPEKTTEIWRYVTYQFVHLDLMHLLENIAGLGLVAYLAMELKTVWKQFYGTYFSAGLLSVIPIWTMISFIALGASNAIFGGFGLVSQEVEKLRIKKSLVMGIIIIAIFGTTIANYINHGNNIIFINSYRQAIAHLSGLIFGVGAFYGMQLIRPIIEKKKRHVLRSG